MPRHPARVFRREGSSGSSGKPTIGTIAEGVALGIIACVILLAGWIALPGPDPSRPARMLLLAVTMLAGAAIAAVRGVRALRRSWTGHRRDTGRHHGA
jgi:hypothetical protein